MAAVDEVPRFVVPFKPTLSHMSLAKLAVRLYYEFGLKNLKKALSEIESGIQAEDFKSKDCPPVRSRARGSLLLVPTTLRKKVLGAAECVANEIQLWKLHHRYIPFLDHAKYTLFWRCDGSIDRTKTALEICRNQNMRIATRFDIACRYFLADEVKSLWALLDSKRDAENDQGLRQSFIESGSVRFWVKWLKKKTQIPWEQAAQEYPEGQIYRFMHYNSLPSSFFCQLTPPKREYCWLHLSLCTDHDKRFCLYSMTNEEQEHVMKKKCFEVLELHLNWPLTSLFLETAEKSWDFLSQYNFCRLLESLQNRMHRTDFDFERLANEFWWRSPEHFKEDARRMKLSKKLTKFIEERITESK